MSYIDRWAASTRYSFITKRPETSMNTLGWIYFLGGGFFAIAGNGDALGAVVLVSVFLASLFWSAGMSVGSLYRNYGQYIGKTQEGDIGWLVFARISVLHLLITWGLGWVVFQLLIDSSIDSLKDKVIFFSYIAFCLLSFFIPLAMELKNQFKLGEYLHSREQGVSVSEEEINKLWKSRESRSMRFGIKQLINSVVIAIALTVAYEVFLA